MSFPTQWMQQQQSLQRHVVPVPTGNSMQRFLPNSMGGMGSFLGFMPANPMPTQTIPPSVHVNAPAVQVKTIVLYPSSVKEAFCDWKERFLNGEIEPHNPDFPAKTRWRYWKSICLPNGVHMTGQEVMISQKLKQWRHGHGAVVNLS